MNLLFLSTFYPPHDRGGYDQHCQEVAVRLRKRGHQVLVLTSRYRRDSETGQDEDVIRSLHLQASMFHYRPMDFFLKRPFYERTNLKELRKAIEQFRPDLVVIWNMWNLSPNLAYWAERWMPDRVAYYLGSDNPINPDVHVVYWSTPANRIVTHILKSGLSFIALQQLKREHYPPTLRFQHAACCSRSLQERLVRSGKLPEGSRVVYAGIDPAEFQFRARPISAPQDPLQLLYFGALTSYKGVHTAIEALNLLESDTLGGKAELTILGSGHPEYETQLHNMVVQMNLVDRVHFKGWVSKNEIPQWVERFDVFLFTSLGPEPFGRTIPEAMAAGLVVIGSDVGGAAEIVRQYDDTMLFPPGDARALADQIVRIARDPSLCHRLSLKGRELVTKHFTLDRMVDELEEWLEGLISIDR